MQNLLVGGDGGMVVHYFCGLCGMLYSMADWFVYILRCADDSLYTGITTDLKRRVAEHNSGASAGARYTRARRPVTLVYHERQSSRSAAGQRECLLRTLSKADKERLVSSPTSA